MDFVEKAKEIFGKSAEVSKQAVTKAGNAIQDFSDKSVLKLDIKKLQSERKDLYVEIGEYTLEKIRASEIITKDDETLINFLEKVFDLDEKISTKEKSLSEI